MDNKIPPQDINFNRPKVNNEEDEDDFDERSFKEKMAERKQESEERISLQEEAKQKDQAEESSFDAEAAKQEMGEEKKPDEMKNEEEKMLEKEDEVAEKGLSKDSPTLTPLQKSKLKGKHPVKNKLVKDSRFAIKKGMGKVKHEEKKKEEKVDKKKEKHGGGKEKSDERRVDKKSDNHDSGSDDGHEGHEGHLHNHSHEGPHPNVEPTAPHSKYLKPKHHVESNQSIADNPSIAAIVAASNPNNIFDPSFFKHSRSKDLSKSSSSKKGSSVDSLEGSSGSKIEKMDVLADDRHSEQDFEELASSLIQEAEVLHSGDQTETTISLNLPGSVFDQGVVKIMTYRYRPLEVNLAFSNFSPKAHKALQESSDNLKKALKRKSLKVHQLEITEE